MESIPRILLLGLFIVSLFTMGCAGTMPSQLVASQDAEYFITSDYHIDDPNEFDPDLDWEN